MAKLCAVKVHLFTVIVDYHKLELSGEQAKSYLCYEATLPDIRELAEAMAKMRNVFDIHIFDSEDIEIPIRP